MNGDTLAFEATQVWEEICEVQQEGAPIPSIEAATHLRIKPEFLECPERSDKTHKFWNEMEGSQSTNGASSSEQSGVHSVATPASQSEQPPAPPAQPKETEQDCGTQDQAGPAEQDPPRSNPASTEDKLPAVESDRFALLDEEACWF